MGDGGIKGVGSGGGNGFGFGSGRESAAGVDAFNVYKSVDGELRTVAHGSSVGGMGSMGMGVTGSLWISFTSIKRIVKPKDCNCRRNACACFRSKGVSVDQPEAQGIREQGRSRPGIPS